VPGSPYTDLARPPLDVRGLRRALITPDGLWTRLDLLQETGSTNAEAIAAARAGAAQGLVVVAERQTAGRGRLGRTWVSPPRAGIAASMLLRPGVADVERGWTAVPSARYAWLPLLAGVALAEVVTRVAELPAGLKWPNDLVVDDAKCGGILVEAVAPGPVEGRGGPVAPLAVVVGVGLNVTLRTAELPVAATALPITSLQLAGAATVDRDPLLRALLRAVDDWYRRWRRAGGDPVASGLRDAYLRACVTIGRDVRVSLPDGTEREGRAVAVDQEGRLVVRGADGEVAVAAGDVVHVRAAGAGPSGTGRSGNGTCG